MKIITFILLIFSLVCHSQIIDFPDSNFKNALLNHDPPVDLNGDGEIQVSEAEAFHHGLNVGESNISDLSGIGFFTSLTSLYCYNNSLTSLDLSQNSLTLLSAGYNQLTTLNITNNPIINLWCNDNQLTELDLSTNTQLEYFDCSFNNLTNIDVTNSLNLIYFSCYKNQISILDIQNLSSLEDVRAAYNLLTTLDISNSIKLKRIDVRYNQISSIDISNCIELERIDVDYNQISSIDLSNLPKIRDLYCNDNLLTSLNLSNLPSLEDLECSNNQITDIEFSLNPEPNNFYLNCEANQLTQLDLQHLPIKRLECADNIYLVDINLRNTSNRNIILTESTFYNLPLLNSVCIDNDPVNYGLIDLIRTQTGHQVDFYTNENCDVLRENQESQISSLTISPNPVKDNLNINSNYSLKSIQIFNTIGQNVFSEENLNTPQINVSNLNSGVYFLKLTDDRNNSITKKLLKQ